MISIFKSIYEKKPYRITVSQALDRIRSGKSKAAVEELRSEEDAEKAKLLKVGLPAITFSGEFKDRNDNSLIRHSGYVCLDFDKISNVDLFKRELSKNAYIYAAWVSPSGNGVKALIKIADTLKHNQHYDCIIEDFKCDPSCKNVSRVCFESYDPEIIINEKAKTYTKTGEIVRELTDSEKFENLLKWLINKGGAFREGERNHFLFRLASACCRFGVQQSECENLILTSFPIEKTFSQREALQVVKSAYKSNDFNSCEMKGETFIDKGDGKEIDPSIFNLDIKPKDIIYARDVFKDIEDIAQNGWTQAETTHVPKLDQIWKWKRGDLNILTGYGNHGKSAVLYYLCYLKARNEGKRYCIFSPETYPAPAFYIDLIEMYLGRSIAGELGHRVKSSDFVEAAAWVDEHFFYVYPSELSPTPEYLKERFLEMIIKEKVDGCIIDPFNQMENSYERHTREDQYLSTMLSDFSRFAKQNDIYFFIVAHPHKPTKGKDEKDYPCPSAYNLSGGAMWNNKADNILVYHRPYYETDPANTLCEIHSKKIKRQKEVGLPGCVEMHYERETRRFNFGETQLRPIYTVKQIQDEEDLF